MRAILSAVVLLACVGFTTADDKKEEKIDAKKLIGKWEPTNVPKGAEKPVMEFAEKGKLFLTIKPVGTVEGTWKLDGNKLEVSVPVGGTDMKETFTLSKVTDDEIVGKDSRGKEDTLKRVKPKK